MLRFLLLATTLTILGPANAQSYNWIRSPINGHLYAVTTPQTWSAAEQAAVGEGGHLVTIRSQQEQDWLINTFGSGHYWIGLNDAQQEDVFEWTSGEPFSYRNWCPGQPDASSPGEDYVHIAEYPGWCSGGWNDQDNGDLFPGIIERPFDPAFGDILWVSRSRVGAFRSLQAAIDTALPGDTIRVDFDRLTYTRVQIDKSLTIEGWPRASLLCDEYQPVIMAQSTTPGIPLTIRNIDFSQHFFSYIAGCAVDLSGDSIVIEGCNFSASTQLFESCLSGAVALRATARTITVLDTTVQLGYASLAPYHGCPGCGPSPGATGSRLSASESMTLSNCHFEGMPGQDILNLSHCSPWSGSSAGDGGPGLVWSSPRLDACNVTSQGGRGGRSSNPQRWSYGTDAPSYTLNQGDCASYGTYRQSCRSSAGLPTLMAANPVIGHPWTLSVDNLAPQKPGYLIFSLEDQWFGLNRLPMDLVSIGAPACFMNVSLGDGSGAIAQLVPSNASGRVRVTVPVPSDPTALGFEFFNQYVSMDAPSSRSLGITTTNAGRGVIGF